MCSRSRNGANGAPKADAASRTSSPPPTCLTEDEPIAQRSADAAAAIAAIAAAIREFFADGRIPESTYCDLVDRIDGPDPDDRHHMAASIAAGVENPVTWDRSDFPVDLLRPHGISVVDPDTNLCTLLDDFPDEVTAATVRLAAG